MHTNMPHGKCMLLCPDIFNASRLWCHAKKMIVCYSEKFHRIIFEIGLHFRMILWQIFV